MSTEDQLPVAVQNLRRLWFNKKANEKITQNDAAKALGWNQSLFSHYIANINKLSDPTVWKLANFFEVSPYDIDPDYGKDYPDSIVLKTNNNQCVPVAPLYKAKPADLYRVTEEMISKKTWNNLGKPRTGNQLIDTVIWAVPRTSGMAKYQRRAIYLIRWKGEWKIQYIPKEMLPKAAKASDITSIKPIIAIFT
mgnify:CR=1 FL=1